jgi:hypothetical protein
MSDSLQQKSDSSWWRDCSSAATTRFGSIPEDELDPAGQILRDALREPTPLKSVRGGGKAAPGHYQPPLLAVIPDSTD